MVSIFNEFIIIYLTIFEPADYHCSCHLSSYKNFYFDKISYHNFFIAKMFYNFENYNLIILIGCICTMYKYTRLKLVFINNVLNIK